MASKIGLDRLLPRGSGRLANLAVATLNSNIVRSAGKLATARQLSEQSAAHSLGAALDVGYVDWDGLYTALSLLGQRQLRNEAALEKRYLKGGHLVLYNLTSPYLEGQCCDLAQHGYSRGA